MIDALVRRFRAHLQASGLVEPGSRLVVALSGGGDSVALLELLHRSGLELRLEAAHLDHALRQHSEQDAQFCQNLCDELGVRLHRRRLEIAELARSRGLSVEHAGREARYALLRELAADDLAATAHTREDQAETVLMRALEGCALGGLAGIRERHGGWLIRPLLEFHRQPLRDFLRGLDRSWLEDPSNRSTEQPRARLRHELMPRLADWNPRVVEALANLAEAAGVDHDCLSRLARGHYGQLATGDSGRVLLAVDALAGLQPALRRRVLLLACRQLGSHRLERHHLLALEELLEKPSGKWTPLPGGLRGLRRGSQLVIGPDQDLPEVAFRLEPGTVALEPWGLELIVSPTVGAARPAPREVVLDAALLAPTLTVRCRRPGDRIKPPGAPGAIEIKKLLPALRRDTTPILTSHDQPVWILGDRVDRRFLASPDTPTPIRLNLKTGLPSSPGEQ